MSNVEAFQQDARNTDIIPQNVFWESELYSCYKVFINEENSHFTKYSFFKLSLKQSEITAA